MESPRTEVVADTAEVIRWPEGWNWSGDKENVVGGQENRSAVEHVEEGVVRAEAGAAALDALREAVRQLQDVVSGGGGERGGRSVGGSVRAARRAASLLSAWASLDAQVFPPGRGALSPNAESSLPQPLVHTVLCGSVYWFRGWRWWERQRGCGGASWHRETACLQRIVQCTAAGADGTTVMAQAPSGKKASEKTRRQRARWHLQLAAQLAWEMVLWLARDEIVHHRDTEPWLEAASNDACFSLELLGKCGAVLAEADTGERPVRGDETSAEPMQSAAASPPPPPRSPEQSVLLTGALIYLVRCVLLQHCRVPTEHASVTTLIDALHGAVIPQLARLFHVVHDQRGGRVQGTADLSKYARHFRELLTNSMVTSATTRETLAHPSLFSAGLRAYWLGRSHADSDTFTSFIQWVQRVSGAVSSNAACLNAWHATVLEYLLSVDCALLPEWVLHHEHLLQWLVGDWGGDGAAAACERLADRLNLNGDAASVECSSTSAAACAVLQLAARICRRHGSVAADALVDDLREAPALPVRQRLPVCAALKVLLMWDADDTLVWDAVSDAACAPCAEAQRPLRRWLLQSALAAQQAGLRRRIAAMIQQTDVADDDAGRSETIPQPHVAVDCLAQRLQHLAECLHADLEGRCPCGRAANTRSDSPATACVLQWTASVLHNGAVDAYEAAKGTVAAASPSRCRARVLFRIAGRLWNRSARLVADDAVEQDAVWSRVAYAIRAFVAGGCGADTVQTLREWSATACQTPERLPRVWHASLARLALGTEWPSRCPPETPPATELLDELNAAEVLLLCHASIGSIRPLPGMRSRSRDGVAGLRRLLHTAEARLRVLGEETAVACIAERQQLLRWLERHTAEEVEKKEEEQWVAPAASALTPLLPFLDQAVALPADSTQGTSASPLDSVLSALTAHDKHIPWPSTTANASDALTARMVIENALDALEMVAACLDSLQCTFSLVSGLDALMRLAHRTLPKAHARQASGWVLLRIAQAYVDIGLAAPARSCLARMRSAVCPNPSLAGGTLPLHQLLEARLHCHQGDAAAVWTRLPSVPQRGESAWMAAELRSQVLQECGHWQAAYTEAALALRIALQSMWSGEHHVDECSRVEDVVLSRLNVAGIEVSIPDAVALREELAGRALASSICGMAPEAPSMDAVEWRRPLPAAHCVCSALQRMAAVCLQMDSWQDAEYFLQRAVQLADASRSVLLTPTAVVALGQYAVLLSRRGRIAEACKRLRQAVRWLQHVGGSTTSALPLATVQLECCHAEMWAWCWWWRRVAAAETSSSSSSEAMSALRKAERLYRHVLQQIERLGGAAARQQRQPSSAADAEGYWTALEHTVRARLATVLWRRQQTERPEPAVDRLDAALTEAERVLGCASAPVAAQAEALVVQAHGGILPVVTAAQRESEDAALVARWLQRAADVCEKQCIPLPPGAVVPTPSASAEAVMPPLLHARLLASVAQVGMACPQRGDTTAHFVGCFLRSFGPAFHRRAVCRNLAAISESEAAPSSSSSSSSATWLRRLAQWLPTDTTVLALRYEPERQATVVCRLAARGDDDDDREPFAVDWRVRSHDADETPADIVRALAVLLEDAAATSIAADTDTRALSPEARAAWWRARTALDRRLQQLLQRLQASLFGETAAAVGALGDASGVETPPVIALVDEYFDRLPLECLPCLRDTPTTRFTSGEALYRALQRQQHHGKQGSDGDAAAASHPLTGAYLLNPQGDLALTQATLAPVLQGGEAPDTAGGIVWCSVESGARDACGRVCLTEAPRWSQAVQRADVFLFCGHGSGEAYVSPRQLGKLRAAAAAADTAIKRPSTVLLMGCSSGQLEHCSGADSLGTALDWQALGARSVLAQLWDVTDRDIDRLTVSLLHHWRPREKDKSSSSSSSLAAALVQARRACRLQWMTGAAAVIYGLG